MVQNIFIIGLGNVGKELIRQVCSLDIRELGIHHNPTNIVGLANSEYYFFNYSGVNFPIKELNKPDFNVKKFIQNKGVKYQRHSELIEIIRKNGLEGNVIFVDATADKYKMIKFHVNVITNTENKIVTCNKNPSSLSSFDDFVNITKNRNRYGMRATLMAGSHAIDQLREFYDTCEEMKKIEGCFSGTLGYITSELDKGKKFSEIIKEAHEKGYTEPNPIDDLNGLDVARKLLIIARSLSLDVNMNDIELKPMINCDKYSNYTIDEFFEKVSEEDEKFLKLVSLSKKQNKAIRYTALLDLRKEKPRLKVGLSQVDKESHLGTLKGTANKIVMLTNNFTKNNEYIIQSPGAGTTITASGIRRDLLQMLQQRVYSSYSN